MEPVVSCRRREGSVFKVCMIPLGSNNGEPAMLARVGGQLWRGSFFARPSVRPVGERFRSVSLDTFWGVALYPWGCELVGFC